MYILHPADAAFVIDDKKEEEYDGIGQIAAALLCRGLQLGIDADEEDPQYAGLGDPEFEVLGDPEQKEATVTQEEKEQRDHETPVAMVEGPPVADDPEEQVQDEQDDEDGQEEQDHSDAAAQVTRQVGFIIERMIIECLVHEMLEEPDPEDKMSAEKGMSPPDGHL